MANPVNEKPQLPLTPSLTPEEIGRNQNDLVVQLQRLFQEYGFAVNSLLAGGAFSVYLSGDQTGVLDMTWTVVEWDTKEFDTNDEYDGTTNFRFTPTVAGKYLLSSNIQLNVGVDQDIYRCSIWKNGSAYKDGNRINFSGIHPQAVNVSAVVDANGTTDYFEIRVWHDTGADKVIEGSNSIESHFTGAWIR